MKFVDYWEQLENLTPALKEPSRMIKISVAGFKVELEKAFAAGKICKKIDICNVVTKFGKAFSVETKHA